MLIMCPFDCNENVMTEIIMVMDIDRDYLHRTKLSFINNIVGFVFGVL